MEKEMQDSSTNIINLRKRITWENFEREIHLLNLNRSLLPQQKFEIVLASCDDEIADLILEENIMSWQDLENTSRCKNIDIDQIIEVCCQRKLHNEQHLDFARRIKEELSKLGVSEKSIINHLAVNIWPNRVDIAVLLRLNQTFKEFEFHVSQIEENDKRRAFKRKTKQIICKKCQKIGHSEITCNKIEK